MKLLLEYISLVLEAPLADVQPMSPEERRPPKPDVTNSLRSAEEIRDMAQTNEEGAKKAILDLMLAHHKTGDPEAVQALRDYNALLKQAGGAMNPHEKWTEAFWTLQNPYQKAAAELDEFSPDNQKERRALSRFYGKKYRAEATKRYRLFATPITVVPYHSGKQALGSNWTRSNVISDTNEQKKMLDGFHIKNAETLHSRLAKGECVMVSGATSLQAGTLPSPWMLVHAIFDGGDLEALSPVLAATYEDIVLKLEGLSDRGVRIDSLFTMRSAREQNIDTENDAAAEAMCQELLTPSGFTFKESDDQSTNDTMASIKDSLSGMREVFDRAIKGKLMTVSVYEE